VAATALPIRTPNHHGIGSPTAHGHTRPTEQPMSSVCRALVHVPLLHIYHSPASMGVLWLRPFYACTAITLPLQWGSRGCDLSANPYSESPWHWLTDCTWPHSPHRATHIIRLSSTRRHSTLAPRSRSRFHGVLVAATFLLLHRYHLPPQWGSRGWRSRPCNTSSRMTHNHAFTDPMIVVTWATWVNAQPAHERDSAAHDPPTRVADYGTTTTPTA
jgi:hypothetical protein